MGEEAKITSRLEIVEKLKIGFVAYKQVNADKASVQAAAAAAHNKQPQFLSIFISDSGTPEERGSYFATEEDYAHYFADGGQYHELSLADDYASILGLTCRGVIDW